MENYNVFLYIDYENVQDITPESIDDNMKVKILVGKDQTKINVELVQKIQPLGKKVEWIHLLDKGKNALDFVIAFLVGTDVTVHKNKNNKYIIYSKDTGYDALVNYLKRSGVKASRIASFQELKKTSKVEEVTIDKIKESLAKVASNKRPKKRNTLSGFIIAQHKGVEEKEIDKIIDQLMKAKVVTELDGIIKYAI